MTLVRVLQHRGRGSPERRRQRVRPFAGLSEAAPKKRLVRLELKIGLTKVPALR